MNLQSRPNNIWDNLTGRLSVLFLLILLSYTEALTQLGSWGQLPAFPLMRSGYAAAKFDLKIYLMGGRYGSSNYDDLYVSTYSNAGWSATPWASLAPMGVSRFCAAAAAAPNGRIYVFGGYLGGGSTPSNSVQEYNPITNTWATRAPMPAARARMVAVTVNGLIYVLGGANNLGTGTNTVFVYNPGTNSWSSAAPMATARADHAATAYSHYTFAGDRLAISGGRSSVGGSPMSSLEIYDPMTLTWSSPPWNLPSAVYGHSMTYGPITYNFFVGGGTDGAGTILNSYYRGTPVSWWGWQPMNFPLDRPMTQFHFLSHNNAFNGSEDIIALAGLTTGNIPANNYEVMYSTIVFPQALLYLQAQPDGPVVRLDWKQEVPSATAFDLERSTDGISFVPLRTANCPSGESCTAVDPNPTQGLNYYRIRVTLADGSCRPSQIAYVDFSRLPVSASVTAIGDRQYSLSYTLPLGTHSAHLSILSMDGKLISRQALPLSNGHQALDLSTLSVGCYILQVQTNDQATSLKLLLD